MGDFILALGAIRQITRHSGEENCGLIVGTNVATLAREEFPRATIIPVSRLGGGIKDSLALYFNDSRKFSHYSFETLIALRYQRTMAHHLLLSWIHAKYSIGFTNSTTGLLLSDEQVFQFPLADQLPLPMEAPPGVCVELERHRVLAEHICQRSVSMADVLPVFSSVVSTEGNDLVVSPFSSQLVKDYPPRALASALSEVSAAFPIRVLLCGSPAQERRLEELAALLKAKGIPDVRLHAAPSIVHFARTIAGAKAVVTMDTAAAHIATALDKPAVILLGGGQYGIFGPWQRSSKQVWLHHELPCYGCDWKCIYPETRCLTEIPPALIAKAVLNSLGATA